MIHCDPTRRGLVVSGHRDLVEDDGAIVCKAIAEFIGYNEFDYMMFGGARGTDTIALLAALEYRQSCEKPPMLIVVVPDVLASQPRETWGPAQRADRIIELGYSITKENNFWALRHRNEVMVDWVFPNGRLLAFWNGERSGTANAVGHARDTGLDCSVRTIRSVPRGQRPAWTPVRT